MTQVAIFIGSASDDPIVGACAKVLKQLGTVLASNYIYAIPLVTIITAVIALGERITPVAIAGAVAIVAGMVMAEMKRGS